MGYLDKTPLVYRRLHQHIIEDKFSPGSRLVERKLAADFQMSSVPKASFQRTIFVKTIKRTQDST